MSYRRTNDGPGLEVESSTAGASGDDDLRGRYRIEFSIQRRQPGEEDFTEVGFGSSGSWMSLGQAAHILESMVEHQEWETTDGMPDPETVR